MKPWFNTFTSNMTSLVLASLLTACAKKALYNGIIPTRTHIPHAGPYAVARQQFTELLAGILRAVIAVKHLPLRWLPPSVI